MNPREFRHFCETNRRLKVLWKKMFVSALKLLEKRIDRALKIRQEIPISAIDETEYANLCREFELSKQSLKDACGKAKIAFPEFTLEDIGSLSYS